MGINTQDFVQVTAKDQDLTKDDQPNGKATSETLHHEQDAAQFGHILNFFADLEHDSEPSFHSEKNLMRVSLRSKVSRNRLLAIRRQVPRCAHPQARPLGQLRSERSLREIRAHVFCDDAPERYSLPLRIATHSINMALIVAVLPIGAASLTYNLLRGEDMAVTARLTTLAGLVLVLFGGQSNTLFGAI